MLVSYDTIHGKNYPIACKTYMPESGSVKGIILGVHGFAGDKESSALEAIASVGEKHGFSLRCFDFPAHGASPADESCLTVESCISDLLQMAEICRAEHPDVPKMLFATSYGGFIALNCLDRLEDFSVVFRAPAVSMPERFCEIHGITEEEFESTGYVGCGFERRMRVPYAFYKELKEYSLVNRMFSERFLIIHGDADTVIPVEDIRKFCVQNPGTEPKIVTGADHRFKKCGELDAVVQFAFSFWLKGYEYGQIEQRGNHL